LLLWLSEILQDLWDREMPQRGGQHRPWKLCWSCQESRICHRFSAVGLPMPLLDASRQSVRQSNTEHHAISFFYIPLGEYGSKR
jgi:hypothetical protein